MVPVWVLDMGLSGAELATYVALRSFANQRGAAHPRVSVIAERAGVTKRTAEKAIARLRELGMLSSAQRRRPDGSIAGCSYHLMDRRPVVGASAPPVPADGGGTGQLDGGAPSQRREQEHTTEHTRENTPGSAPRASGEERDDSCEIKGGRCIRWSHAPRHKNEERSDDGTSWAAGTSPSVKVAAAHLATEIVMANQGRIAVGVRAVGDLLAPALGNGVPPDKLKSAVRRLLEDGKKLAPWTLQEYVALVCHVDRGGVAGW